MTEPARGALFALTASVGDETMEDIGSWAAMMETALDFASVRLPEPMSATLRRLASGATSEAAWSVIGAGLCIKVEFLG